MFSKQTSNAASAWEVKTVLDSPTTSLGFWYSFPTASRIYQQESSVASIKPAPRCLNTIVPKRVALRPRKGTRSPYSDETYVNVDHHAITLGTPDHGGDDHQGLLAHKVPDASLLLDALAARVRGQVELEGGRDADEEKQAAEVLQQRLSWRHRFLFFDPGKVVPGGRFGNFPIPPFRVSADQDEKEETFDSVDG